ncbi:carbon storage regulator [Planctomicrobium sp. SH664]|uniref:carbon storage regulator n=1 Tax=Planctomicrobium sp. SH664 TaxID=3448125 RepID=UPI003F5B834E
MLVVSRKPSEQIQIGDDVVITIVRISDKAVRVGIDAPRSINIIRRNAPAPVERKECHPDICIPEIDRSRLIGEKVYA